MLHCSQDLGVLVVVVGVIRGDYDNFDVKSKRTEPIISKLFHFGHRKSAQPAAEWCNLSI